MARAEGVSARLPARAPARAPSGERRLLERIADREAGGERSPSADVLARSIIDHLRRILNTRQGHVPIDPAFGVPDFTNLAGGFAQGSAREIEAQIERVIACYEPRLKSPRVTLAERALDAATLHFSLDARLVLDAREVPARFLTTVSGNGKIDIRTIS
ncbi:type VI secretion system baseplate subunit TssE [Burkholderia thailandensis]|uniref:type VI secretion system baseplate subunit TssE n=1 Tax=Burkholderia thailandensis TaxID=57975 RepID=UPI00217CECFB|nr:type VI secretion system baseplate subunit TssE [Burkholderia thailandensis]MCS6499213.1 type VI secretion system baseplate subunit TssE [Burkholderia thailandensis]